MGKMGKKRNMQNEINKHVAEIWGKMERVLRMHVHCMDFLDFRLKRLEVRMHKLLRPAPKPRRRGR